MEFIAFSADESSSKVRKIVPVSAINIK